MDQKEEFANIIQDADQSREKSLILLMCASKSMASLQDEFEKQQFDEEQTEQLNQLLDCVENIIYLWLSKLNHGKVELDDVMELIEESDILNVFVNLFYRNLTEKFNKIEQILCKIFSNLSIAKDNQILFYLFLMAITQKFKENDGKEKFLISEKLNCYLNKNLKFCLNNEKVKNCIKILGDCIYDILKNKLSEELRSPIFILLATITYHYESLDWFIKNGDERRSFLLISRLACIESRMCLDMRQNNLDLLTSSLIIVEHSIKALIEEDDFNSESEYRIGKFMKNSIHNYLKNNDIIQLIDAIKLLIQSIVIYLIENKGLIKESQNSLNEKKDYMTSYNQFQVCLRVLCLYLTFENEFLKNDFEQIIFLISHYILNEFHKTNRNNNLIHLCLNSLISIIDNDEKYKEEIKKLNLIDEIESQINTSQEELEVLAFQNFLDSMAN